MNTEISDQELRDFFILNQFKLREYIKDFFEKEAFVFIFNNTEEAINYENLLYYCEHFTFFRDHFDNIPRGISQSVSQHKLAEPLAILHPNISWAN